MRMGIFQVAVPCEAPTTPTISIGFLSPLGNQETSIMRFNERGSGGGETRSHRTVSTD